MLALCAVHTSPALSAGSVKEAHGAVRFATSSTRSWPSALKTHYRYISVGGKVLFKLNLLALDEKRQAKGRKGSVMMQK